MTRPRRPVPCLVAIALLLTLRSRPATAAAIAATEPVQGSPGRGCDRGPILVRNARLWNPSGRGRVQDVLFEDGRVAAIRPGGSIVPSPHTRVRVLEGRGQTLLPGLIDLHLHFGVPGGLPESEPATPSTHWNITGRQLLRSGVTSGRIHLMSLAAASQIRKEAADPCAALPRLQAAGPGMAGGVPETETPNYVGVRNPEDAMAKVRRVADAGLEWIAVDDAEKFLPGELEALTTTARARGLRLMGGADREKELEVILAAGVDTIDMSNVVRYPDRLLRRVGDRPGVTVVPVVGYHYRIHAFDRNPRLLEAPSNFAFLDAAEKAFVLSRAKQAMEKDGFIVKSRGAYPGLGAMFRRLLAAGVPIAAGTDVGSAAHFHAGAIWWELNAWRAFGASPRAALAGATATAARVLRDTRAGALKEDAYADFVLYAGDVERGEFDMGRIRAVAKAGVLFVRDGVWVGPGRDETPSAARDHPGPGGSM